MNLVQIQAPGAAAQRSLSPSQVKRWLNCPASWYFRYVLHCDEPPHASLVLGRAVDAAVGFTVASRIAGDEISEHAALTTFEASFLDHALGAYFAPNEDPELFFRYGEDLVRQWCRKAPLLIGGKLLHSQLRVEGSISTVPVITITDIVTEEFVIDTKTSKRKPGVLRRDDKLQVATYAYLLNARKARVITGVTGRTDSWHTSTFEITNADRQFVERIYPTVAEAIDKKAFTPNRLSYLCSKRYCAFWRQCEEIHGGTVQP